MAEICGKERNAAFAASTLIWGRQVEQHLSLRRLYFGCVMRSATLAAFHNAEKMANVRCCNVLLPLFFFALFIKVNSLSFTLAAGSKKCLREEVHKDILVTGEYRLSEAPIKTHLTVS